MIFNSSIFLFGFLPGILLLYYISPIKFRNVMLLLSSLFFYSWGNIEHIKILIFSIITNYIVGVLLQYYPKLNKKLVCICGILLNLMVLGYFKYLNFIINNMNHIMSVQLSVETIILPIGISFFTFQGLSYIVDVYRGKIKGNSNFVQVALYISFFPQLIAGPIVRYTDIYSQIICREHTIHKFSAGIERFVFGFAKKVIVADILGETANQIFQEASLGIDIPTAWLGIICYTFQIYYDFSGYSDMAIGLGKLFGFKFLENFNYPYISASITEFWRRWHISLGTWFREYVYIPLGGNKSGNVYLNLSIVFILTGLWHGAEWKYILWGIWNGIFIICDKIIQKKEYWNKIPKGLKISCTFFIVMMGWVMFGIPGNMSNVMQYYKNLFDLNAIRQVDFTFSYYFNYRLAFTLFIAIIGSFPLWKNCKENWSEKFTIQLAKKVYVCVVLILSIMYMINSTYNPFIYFQF